MLCCCAMRVVHAIKHITDRSKGSGKSGKKKKSTRDFLIEPIESTSTTGGKTRKRMRFAVAVQKNVPLAGWSRAILIAMLSRMIHGLYKTKSQFLKIFYRRRILVTSVGVGIEHLLRVGVEVKIE